ncbi:MAG TPA: hypothetical protein VNN74_05015 [Candidatus Micrarchaeia archaeon]|nr:hypothetical protein [Candidatus Micrarchaeia archaeon]
MDGGEAVVIFSSFLKLTGEIAVTAPLRLTDVVNRRADFLEVRNVSLEPLASTYPVVSHVETSALVAKASIVFVAPVHEAPLETGRRSALLVEKVIRRVAVSTDAFSLVCEVFLEPRLGLRETIERNLDDFIPVRNLSAVWVPALTREPVSIQRPFALLQPRRILSFAEREDVVT